MFHLLDVSSSRPGVSEEELLRGAVRLRPGDPEGVVGLVKGHQVRGRLHFASCKVRKKSRSTIWPVGVSHREQLGSSQTGGLTEQLLPLEFWNQLIWAPGTF